MDLKANPQLGNRCVVALYAKYISLCDATVDHVWCKPIQEPKHGKWYSRQKVGIHKSEQMLKTIATEGGLPGRVTNHSMRKTTVKRLSKAKVPDDVIKAITGHRSDGGLAAYKEVDQEDIGEATRILSGIADASTTPTIKFPLQQTTNDNGLKNPIQFHFNNCNVTINN